MESQKQYLSSPALSKNHSRYSITFLPQKKTIQVDSDKLVNLPKSILDIALESHMDIDHACGGVCACSTCHIIVKKGIQSCNSTTDEEEDQLEKAPGLTPLSRLACQCIPTGTEDLVIEVPQWNRNLVREGKLP